MEIYRYLNVLRKYLAVIVLLSALGGGSAYWFSLRQHPVYEAKATLLINAAAPSSLIPYLASATGNNGGAGALATGALTPLYNPRTALWAAHFRLSGALIEPLTVIGRATAFLLRLNDPERVTIRANLLRQGRYAPPH